MPDENGQRAFQIWFLYCQTCRRYQEAIDISLRYYRTSTIRAWLAIGRAALLSARDYDGLGPWRGPRRPAELHPRPRSGDSTDCVVMAAFSRIPLSGRLVSLSGRPAERQHGFRSTLTDLLGSENLGSRLGRDSGQRAIAAPFPRRDGSLWLGTPSTATPPNAFAVRLFLHKPSRCEPELTSDSGNAPYTDVLPAT